MDKEKWQIRRPQNPEEKSPRDGQYDMLVGFDAEKIAALEKFKDPQYLPRHQEVIDTFGLAMGRFDRLEFEDDPTYRKKTLFDDFCLRYIGHEFLTQEYIDALSEHITNEFAAYSERVTVLEVGAGNGRLSHFLRLSLAAKESGKFEVYAVDAQEHHEGYSAGEPLVGIVEKMDYRDALAKYKPHLVVSSWMPGNWTREIENTASVQEYILIGDQDATVNADELASMTAEEWAEIEKRAMNREDHQPFEHMADYWQQEPIVKAEQYQIPHVLASARNETYAVRRPRPVDQLV